MTKNCCFWPLIGSTGIFLVIEQTGDSSVREITPELLAQLREAAQPYAEAEGGPHGLDHSERVLHNTLYLGKELGADLHILAPAAILHDIGRSEESASRGAICHARRGAELAVPILEQLGYGQDEIKAICHAIVAHRYRGAVTPQSLEARILFDADKLDSIGAVGIGRAFLFAGQIGARLHNPEADHSRTKSYTLEDSAYREFQVKLCKVKDQMQTELGRKLAQERHVFMQVFFTQLTRETSGLFSETNN
ncbi:MAG: HD domain-containing protein [Desulfobulbaceae bacterium]|nr:HD domain-containing protein [Desulfobulbaceae bacterium]